MNIKIPFCLLVLAGLLVVAGCSTPSSVAQLKGQGARRTYDVRYDCAWTTVRSVAVMEDLHILRADKKTGFISARRGMGDTTFGDCVAIWLRPISPNQTEVEVVSRRVGAPVPFAPNEEETILASLDDVLSF